MRRLSQPAHSLLTTLKNHGGSEVFGFPNLELNALFKFYADSNMSKPIFTDMRNEHGDSDASIKEEGFNEPFYNQQDFVYTHV